VIISQVPGFVPHCFDDAVHRQPVDVHFAATAVPAPAAGHLWPHCPQLFGSLIGLTQTKAPLGKHPRVVGVTQP
jgi:hypothetical protein